MPQVNFGGFQPAIASMADVNSYAVAAWSFTGHGFNQVSFIGVMTSKGGADSFGQPYIIQTGGAVPGQGGLSLAYLPVQGQPHGRLFLVYCRDQVVISELKLATDGSGNVSVVGIVQSKTLYQVTSMYRPGLSFMGNQLVLALAKDYNAGYKLVVSISNDVVATPNDLTFNTAADLSDSSDAGPGLAIVPGPGPQIWLTWKGQGNTDINIAMYDSSANDIYNKITISNSTITSPELTYCNGQLYLTFIGTAPNVNIWPQADWGKVNPRVLPDVAREVSICPSVDAQSLMLAWIISTEGPNLIVSNEAA